MFSTSTTTATESLFYSKVCGLTTELVHRFVCQEIFTVKQSKYVKTISVSEGDMSCRTKPSVPGSSQVMNT